MLSSFTTRDIIGMARAAKVAFDMLMQSTDTIALRVIVMARCNLVCFHERYMIISHDTLALLHHCSTLRCTAVVDYST